MTQEEIARWSEVFTVFSSERFGPLFGDMGLPAPIAAAPQGLIRCARALLREGDLRAAEPHEAEARIERAFACIADAYDRETMIAFRDRCRLWVAQTHARALVAWEHLLRRLCALVSDDGLTVRPPLDSARQTRLCECVSAHIGRGVAEEGDTRIDIARRRAESAWEARLEDRVRDSAGDGPTTLGAVEMALTTASLMIRDSRTHQATKCLRSELSDEERQRVFTWAQAQGDRLGLPPSGADPSALPDP